MVNAILGFCNLHVYSQFYFEWRELRRLTRLEGLSENVPIFETGLARVVQGYVSECS